MFLWDEHHVFPLVSSPRLSSFLLCAHWAKTANGINWRRVGFCVSFRRPVSWKYSLDTTWQKRDFFSCMHRHTNDILIVPYILCKMIHGSSLLLCIIFYACMHVCITGCASKLKWNRYRLTCLCVFAKLFRSASMRTYLLLYSQWSFGEWKKQTHRLQPTNLWNKITTSA